MTSVVGILFFSAIISNINAASLQFARNDICRELCQLCGGEDTLLENACVCSLPQQALDQETLKRFRTAQLRADSNRLPFLLQLDAPESDQLPTANHISKAYLLRRLKRNPDLSYRGASLFDQNGQYKPGQAAVYELVIGDNNDDSVQLGFPESIDVDVKHQYLFETPDGVHHPLSDLVRDSSYSEEYSKELEPMRKNFNQLTGHKTRSNNYVTNFNTMDTTDDLSFEDRNESEDDVWSSETTHNTATQNFDSSHENNEDGYDQYNIDYGTSPSDFATPTDNKPTINLEQTWSRTFK